MSLNGVLAERLHEMSKLMELLGQDSFRASAHARAARAVEAMTADVRSIAADREALLAIEGIGPKLADKIREFCTSGTIAEHAKLREQVPPGLLELLNTPGLGPKTIRVLWTEGGVTDRASLLASIESGAILALPRMGEKAVEKLRQSLIFSEHMSERLPLGVAASVAARVVEHMRRAPGVLRAEAAGSLRRGRDTVGDIDILVAVASLSEDTFAPIAHAFTTMPGVRQVLASGGTRCSVIMAASASSRRWESEFGKADEGRGPSVQVDLRVLPDDSWGAALMYFTGSKDHNVAMRRRALERGLTLNEYGLFPHDDDPTPPHQRGLRPIASRTEEDVFRALDLPFIPPEVREARGEFDAGAPRLIEVTDIRAELHAHTTASDGVLSIVDLARQAQARGFHTIAVTDHSKASAQANGLSVERLEAHVRAIHAARAHTPGIAILAGSEVDILATGALDYDDATLALLDIVVASPHTALAQEPATATARLLKAIEHPRVNILGHPTGRLVNRRPGLAPDFTVLAAAARAHDVALEINAHWARLDLRDVHVRAAVDAGCLIAINCDVHEASDFDHLVFGIVTGRRGWLTPDRCINTWPAEKLHEWLANKRAGRRATPSVPPAAAATNPGATAGGAPDPAVASARSGSAATSSRQRPRSKSTTDRARQDPASPAPKKKPAKRRAPGESNGA